MSDTDVQHPSDAQTGNFDIPLAAAGVVGDIRDTKTVATTPEKRRVVVDTNWLSYHNPRNVESYHGLIFTTEAIAREHGAAGCTGCYGGNNVQYDFDYATDGQVLP